MTYFRLINKGKGPTKLFVGGIHGNEGETTVDFFKALDFSDFSNGITIIYNFDPTDYVSTLKEEYYESDMGIRLINIIKKYKPDFYTELHCYNFENYKKLISSDRMEFQGVPPFIEIENKVLISSVSPIIRKKYFKKETICKTLEIPCKKGIYNQDYSNVYSNEKSNLEFDENLSSKTYLNIIKLISKSSTRTDFEKKMIELYPKQVKLAVKYAHEIFGKDYPPF
jgi:hypothetical protein